MMGPLFYHSESVEEKEVSTLVRGFRETVFVEIKAVTFPVRSFSRS